MCKHCLEQSCTLIFVHAPGSFLRRRSSVQFSCSVVSDCDPMDYSMPDFPVLHYLLEFTQTMSIELVMPSNHLILCHPLLCLPSIFPSIRVFSNESALPISWPKYWNFSLSISPSNEHPGLVSFRMDWLDLLAVQGTLKSLLGLASPFHSLSFGF